MGTVFLHGQSGLQLDALSPQATASQILSGNKAYDAEGNVITGTIASQAAQTITPGTSNKTIASGKYLSGTQTIAGDADLVAGNIKSGVNIFGVTGTLQQGIDINGVIRQYQVLAGDSISAGDFVSFLNGDSFTYGPTQTSGKPVKAGGYIRSALLTSTKVFISWASGSSNLGYCCVATINSDNSITYGTSVQISPVNSCGLYTCPIVLTSTKVLLYHAYNSSTYPYFNVCTIDGSTVTIGSEATVGSDSANRSSYSGVAISETQAIILYYKRISDRYTPYVTVITVNGTAVSSMGTSLAVGSATSNLSPNTLCKLTSNKFYIASFQSYPTAVRGNIITVSGSTVTIENSIALNNNPYYRVEDVIGLSENKTIVVCCTVSGSAYIYEAICCSINNTTISPGEPVEIARFASSVYIYLNVCKINDDKFIVISGENQDSTVAYLKKYLVNGIIITPNDNSTQLTFVDGTNKPYFIRNLNDHQIYVHYGDTQSRMIILTGFSSYIKSYDGSIYGVAKTSGNGVIDVIVPNNN